MAPEMRDAAISLRLSVDGWSPDADHSAMGSTDGAIDHGEVFDASRVTRHKRIEPCVLDGVLRGLENHCAPMMDVHAYLTEDLTTNAFCFERDGIGYIGLAQGLFGVYSTFFKLAMSLPDVLTHVGEPTREDGSRAIGQPTVSFEDNVYQQALDDKVRPTDKDRFDRTRWLTDLAVGFVAFHEAGHLLNGHCALAATLGIAGIDELRNDGGLSDLSRQTLEIDADAYSISVSLRALLRSLASELEGDTTEETLTKQLRPLLVELAFTLGSIFHLWYGDGTRLINWRDCYKHPPPHVRQFLTIRICAAGIFRWTKAIFQNVNLDEHSLTTMAIAALAEGTRDAEIAHARMSGNVPNFAPIADGVAQTEQILRPFTDEWRRLHGALLPLARGRLVDPQPLAPP